MNPIRRALLAAALICLGASRAFAIPQGPTLQDANGVAPSGQATTLDYVGCVPFQVEQTTTPVLITSGPGMLYELNTDSGAIAGSFSVGFDSSVVAASSAGNWSLGLLTTGAAIANLPKGYVITPHVYVSSIGTAAPTTVLLGRFAPAKPRRFKNGLVVANSDSTLSANGCYRTDAMDAAFPVTQ
jgi:hypothetical protein